MTPKDSATVQSWIDRVNSEARNLTDWEEEFMESITEKMQTYGSLTSSQINTLERIYANKTK